MGTSNDLASVGDGCTFWPNHTWRTCCDAHDLAYSMQIPKPQADWTLFTCVWHYDPISAILMLAGLTLFGWIWYRRARRSSSLTVR